jgi:hypothetical protein
MRLPTYRGEYDFISPLMLTSINEQQVAVHVIDAQNSSVANFAISPPESRRTFRNEVEASVALWPWIVVLALNAGRLNANQTAPGLTTITSV